GRATVRLENRAIAVLAELRGAEEQEFARLQMFHHLALGRWQRAPIEHPLFLEECYRLGNLAWSSVLRLIQRTLGKEDLMLDPERSKIASDQVHHASDGEIANDRQPLILGLVPQARTVLARKRLADRHEIIARIQPVGDLTDSLAQRLSVAQIGRAREGFDLRPRIIDVELPRNRVASTGE